MATQHRLTNSGTALVSTAIDDASLPAGSIYFSGASNGQYITVLPNPAFTLGTSNFTIECWWYASGAQNTYSTIYAYANNATNQAANSLYFSPSQGSASVALGNGAGGWVMSPNYSWSQNTWYHHAFVRNGNTFTTYHNGVAVQTATYSGTITAQGNNSFEIGGQVSGSGSLGSTAFLGYVSNFRVVVGTAVYTAAFTPPQSQLTAIPGTVLLLNGVSGSNLIQDFSPYNWPVLNSTSVPASNNNPFTTSGSNYMVLTAGGSNFYSLANNAAYCDFGTGNFTAEAWMYPLSFGTIFTMFCTWNSSAGNARFAAYLSATGPGVDTSSGGTGTGMGLTFTGSTTINLNQWVHYAVTRYGSLFTLWINGVSIATATSTGTFLPTGYSFYIGSYPDGYSTGYGYISNFRVVKGQALYTSTFTPSTVPLTTTSQGALPTTTSLLTLQSPYVIDNSVNNFSISTTGTMIIQSGTAFATNTGGSAYFASSAYFTTPANAAFNVGTQDFTVEGWAYWTGTVGAAATWYGHFYQQFSGDYGINVGIGSTGYPYAYLQNGNGGGQQITLTSGTLAQRCTWIYFALSRIGANASLFVNGVRVATSTAAGITLGHNQVAIGRYSTNTAGNPWLGYVSNVRLIVGTGLYNPTLTSMTVPSGPLTLTSQGANPNQVQLLTCQNPGVISDNSINNWTLTPSSGTFVTAQSNGPFLQNSTTVKQRLVNDGTLEVASQLDDLSLSAGSISFNGSSQYVTAPTGPAFQYGTGNFTIEFWIYPTAFASYKSIQGNNTSAASSTGFHIGLNASGNIFIYSASAFKVTSSNTMTVNSWNHVAVVRNGSTVSIYINGAVSSNTWTLTTETFTDGNCFLGAYYFTGTAGEYTAGYIANLRIVKGTAVYTTAFNPPRSALLPITNTQLLLNGTNSANLLQDFSVNNFPVTSYPGVTVLDNNSPFSTAGLNYAVSLNGSSQYLTIANGSAFNFGTGDFTMEAWVNLATGAAASRLITSRATASGASGTWSFTLSPTTMSFTEVVIGEPGVSATFASSIANTWSHVAVSRSSGTTRLFLNGVQQASGSQTTNFNNTSYSVYIGTSPTENYLQGLVSNVRIINGQALYLANFTPSTTPFTTTSQGANSTQVSLLTCQNSIIRDNSTNNFAVTNNGSAPVVSNSPFVPATIPQSGYSNYFLTANSNMLYYQFPSTIPTVAGDFTVECWIYPTGTESSAIFMFSAQKTAYGADVGIILYKTGGYIAIAGGGGAATGYTANFPSSATAANGQWSHIALVRANGTLTAYLNGVGGTGVAASGTIAPYLNRADLSGPLGYYIGTNQANWTAFSPVYYSGYISNLRYVTGQALYTANFAPPTSPLTTVSQGAIASNVVFLLCQSGSASPTTNAVPGGVAFTNNQTTVATQTNGPFLQNSTALKQRLINDGTLEVYDQFDEVSIGSGAISFNGSTQYLYLINPTATAIRTSNFTWETWIYVTSLSAVISVYDTSASGDTTATGRFLIYIATDGTLRLYTGTTTILLASSAGAITINAWYHIAVTRSGTTGYMFVNGAQVNTATVSTDFLLATLNAGNRPIIGANGYDLSQKLPGYISNLRLVVGTAVYTAAFTPNRTMLAPIQNTQLLLNCANSANLLQDSGPNNYAIIPGPAAYPVVVSNPFVGATINNYMVGTASGQYLSVAYNSALNLTSGDWTVECWFNTTTAGQLIDKDGQASTSYPSYSIGLGSTISCSVGTANLTAIQTLTGATTLLTGVWYHVAFVKSGTTLSVYLNGKLDASATLSLTIGDANRPLYIGNRQTADTPFTGYISNVRITKQALYTAAFPALSSPVTTSTQGAVPSSVSLLTCQSLAIKDNSTNALAMTNTGNVVATPSQGTSTVPVYGVNFNGTSQFLTTPASGVFAQNAFFGASKTFTVEAWVYLNAVNVAAGYYIMILGDASNTSGTFMCWSCAISDALKPAVTWWDGSGKQALGSTALSLNTWYHVAFVSTAGVVTIYVNGVSQTLTGNTTLTNATQTTGIVVGIDRANYLKGYISNLRAVSGLAVYTGNFSVSPFPNVTLAATQTTSPFGGANTVPITGTVTSLLTCQGTNIVDASANPLTITNTGASTFYSTGPFA